MNLKTRITQIHYDRNAKGAFIVLLDFCSLFYKFASRTKNFLYDKKILKPKKVSAYVISIGNMTTGGVGKTPVVLEIAKYLAKKGKKVAIVSRGYGGKLSNKDVNVISDGKSIFYTAQMAGDEPFMLAQKAQGVCVLTCRDRFKASKFAVENFNIDTIILDDGFQHRKLHRDLDIVLMDSKMGLGNEKLLPAGPLREGAEALERIDKLLIVSKNLDHTNSENFAKIISALGQAIGLGCILAVSIHSQRLITGKGHSGTCLHRIAVLIDVQDGSHLHHQPVAAIHGQIG